MKSILLLLCICIMICPAQVALGGFLVKRTVISNEGVVSYNKAGHIGNRDGKKSKILQLKEQLNRVLHMPHDPNTSIVNEKGLFGQLALILGCMSFIPLYGILFGTAAIIFGLIGRHYHQKHSRVGIFLGVLGLAANALFVSILIAEAMGYVTFVVI